MPRLLVIDDEPAIRRVFARAFARDFVVTCVEDAESALAIINEALAPLFDVAVCDLTLPRMSGRAFHGEIERLAPELARRTVILTGQAVADDDPFAASLGERYVRKPCTVDDLLVTLRRLSLPRVTIPSTAPLVAA